MTEIERRRRVQRRYRRQTEPTALPRPCTARPGSDEKIKILAERFGRYQLWHPLDAG